MLMLVGCYHVVWLVDVEFSEDQVSTNDTRLSLMIYSYGVETVDTCES